MTSDNPGPNILSLAFVEGLFEDFLADPSSVPQEWRQYFESLPQVSRGPLPPGAGFGPSFRPGSLFHSGGNGSPGAGEAADEVDVANLQDRVDQLVRAFRVRGHLEAQLDPLGAPRKPQPELEPGFYGLTEADMDRVFSTRTIKGAERLALRDILARLRNTYCRSIGVQFMHIDDLDVKNWLQGRMEATENRLALSSGEQLQILSKLTDATIFEEFIQTKYLGGKSFSLEGAESLIPLLELAIQKAGEQEIEEIVLGMAHRGRLNVLANIMGKRPSLIFREFEDKVQDEFVRRGDVKYHLGYSVDRETVSGNKVHLSLCFNPSHLEFINPVVMGRVRSKQDRDGDHAREHKMALLIHGDAAFVGEGIVQETLNLSQLPGFRTGGTLHVILNNQIGFTTSPGEARSSTYATDVAKMLQIPIFHVNGEDPEAVAQCVRLGMDFRKTYRRDVVIDMYCYRRRGHNEGDEPSFTQPILYQKIAKRRPVRRRYREHLLKLGGLNRDEAEDLSKLRKAQLEEELQIAKSSEPVDAFDYAPGIWRGYVGGKLSEEENIETGVALEKLQGILEALVEVPEEFTPNPKIEKFLSTRRKMAAGNRPLDWSTAEALAFGSLALEGHLVRLSGQDSGRGTFSQRHAILYDYRSGKVYVPLQHLAADQAPVHVVNSPLSESAVLGFEYGYSLDNPAALVMWEAQFGDFSNAAQVIIDQFIAAGEDKWARLSGLVLLLPHGYEGMGPEHSSARLERFLMLAADYNIQVVYPSTPSQYFHCLRRQVTSKRRKPLVIMTPKSLLRHPEVTSNLEDLSRDRFRRVLPDPEPPAPSETEKILICSGKIYYELLERRRQEKRQVVAIHRLEQLYPFPENGLLAALEPYSKEIPVVWVQEEPENMGAWRYLRARFPAGIVGRNAFRGIYRAESASPATRSVNRHKLEQAVILEEAFLDEKTRSRARKVSEQ